jgi:hypothetical protein
MVLTRAAAARLAASAKENSAEADSPVTEPPSKGLAKGRRTKRPAPAATEQNGLEQADPLEEELQRFHAELRAIPTSEGIPDGRCGSTCEEKGHAEAEPFAMEAGKVSDQSRKQEPENSTKERVDTIVGRVKDLSLRDASADNLQIEGEEGGGSETAAARMAKVREDNTKLAPRAPATQVAGPLADARAVSSEYNGAGQSNFERGAARGQSKAVLSAGPHLYFQKESTSAEAAQSEPDNLPAPELGKAALPLVPPTKLTLSRADRARRARILKEALLNVDEKQQTWQDFARKKGSREGDENNAAASSSPGPSGGSQSSEEGGAGWVFGKKVAFSFKPKSTSPAKKGSGNLVRSPSKAPSSMTPVENVLSENLSPAVAAFTAGPGAETPNNEPINQTPLPPQRPALALNTPAVKAQSLSGNPVLDLRFLFPKATSPEPSTPQNVGDSACHPIDLVSSPEEGECSPLRVTFQQSSSFPKDSSAFVGEESSCNDAFATLPGAIPGGFGSPFSIESASPALKEIMRAARSFAAEKGASPSPLNPSPNPILNPVQPRRESYFDVFASPTLVNIFKGARQTVAQKAESIGPEKAKTELELITEAAKEYAASRAQLAVEKKPLGVLCRKENELALSFAEKLQLADPAPGEVLTGGLNSRGFGGGYCAMGENRGVLEQAIGEEPWDNAERGQSGTAQFSDSQSCAPDGLWTVHKPGALSSANQAAPPVRNVSDGPKERAGTLYVVVDTNCYLSASDMPAVRRIYEAAQSVASRQRRFEWENADSVVIVVPDAGENRLRLLLRSLVDCSCAGYAFLVCGGGGEVCVAAFACTRLAYEYTPSGKAT